MIAALVWRTRRHFAGIGRWSMGNLLATLSLLFLGLRGIAPDWLSITVANALVFGAAILFLHGIRRFYGLRIYWWPECLAAAISITVGACFFYVHDDVNARILIWSSTTGGFGLVGGMTLLKRAPARTALPQARIGAILTGSIFLLTGVLCFARAIYVYAYAPVTDLFAPSSANAILFACTGVGMVGWTFGFVLMTNEPAVLESLSALSAATSVSGVVAPPITLADAISTTVPESDVVQQVQRIVQSEMFCRAPRMAQFLTVTVERTLQGRAGELKEYALGRDVFQRGEDFDPRIDSIVRVEAQRLRRKLDEYYENSGKDDMVLIQIRAGSYVPFFTYRKISRQTQS